MLANDLQSLEACSLVCRVMFASARRIIHRRISLTLQKNWELLTSTEKQRYNRGEKQGIAIKMLSGIAARGLLPYARHLSINVNEDFTPTNLQPFNHHFQCFDRIQELSIYWLDTPGFLENFDTYFMNFVPTLRSLHLDTPIGDGRDILDFVCRFPHLDDLTFKIEAFHDWGTWRSGPLPVVKSVPPFRGRLKLDGIVGLGSNLLQQLISLPGKRHFRSIDFRGCNAEEEQPIIDACSDTLESVSTTWKRFCKRLSFFQTTAILIQGVVDEKGLPVNLTDATNLRSLTLRVDFKAIRYSYGALSRTLSTITSPLFSEFVLEVERVPRTLEPARSAWMWWLETWTELDKMFERIDIERGFRVVIRAEKVDKESSFAAQAENRLPLMAARKGIVFEIGQFPEK